MPLVEAIRAHVFAAECIHADDTTMPVQAKGKTRTGRLWAYVHDDRPFVAPDPPAAVSFYSPCRKRNNYKLCVDLVDHAKRSQKALYHQNLDNSAYRLRSR
jgi:hypothetical protein